MKVKLVVVLVAVAVLFIGAVLWRTDSFVYGDRMSWVEAQTRTQLGAMNHSLATELTSLQRVVSTLNAENFQKGKFNWSSVSPYFAVASFALDGDNLDPQILLVKENSKAASWDKDFVKSALSPLVGRTPDVRFYVKPFQDSRYGRYAAVVFIEGRRAYALFGSGEIFQSLIDSQKGALSSFSIVTSSGLTAGHAIPEYLGTVMRDDPVFRDAQESGSSHGSRIFKLKSGDLYGMYELVPQSNLLVLSSAPLTEAMTGRTGLWWQFLLMGCGLVLVGIAAVLWVVMPVEKQVESLTEQMQSVQSKPAAAPTPVPAVGKAAQLDAEQLQQEKVQASMRVASALAHEMRGPLASILGYSQMILAKSPEADIVTSTESILRETRAARGVLDKLLGYAGEEVKEKNSMKIEGPLVKALKELESLFVAKGVKITKNIQETSAVDIHVDAIIRALNNILQNSVEAMERMAKKEIKIDLFEDATGVHLTLQDTGEGIEPQNIEKIFDPFFTTRSFHNHMGLGLSVAYGIFKEHNAEMRVESQPGQGTKILIVFKKMKAEAKTEAEVMPREEERVMIAPELLQLKAESAHREEAEAHFADAKTEVTSPLDVNIEAMLELPEVAESPQKTQGAKDELTFIDGFLGEKPAEAGPTEAELKVMSDEPIPTSLVAPPKMTAQQKVSKLDSFQVEIRRPGKRI